MPDYSSNFYFLQENESSWAELKENFLNASAALKMAESEGGATMLPYFKEIGAASSILVMALRTSEPRAQRTYMYDAIDALCKMDYSLYYNLVSSAVIEAERIYSKYSNHIHHVRLVMGGDAYSEADECYNTAFAKYESLPELEGDETIDKEFIDELHLIYDKLKSYIRTYQAYEDGIDERIAEANSSIKMHIANFLSKIPSLIK